MSSVTFIYTYRVIEYVLLIIKIQPLIREVYGTDGEIINIFPIMTFWIIRNRKKVSINFFALFEYNNWNIFTKLEYNSFSSMPTQIDF